MISKKFLYIFIYLHLIPNSSGGREDRSPPLQRRTPADRARPHAPQDLGGARVLLPGSVRRGRHIQGADRAGEPGGKVAQHLVQGHRSGW